MDAESTGIKEEYDGGFSQVAATGSWSDVADILGEKKQVLYLWKITVSSRKAIIES